MPIWDHWGGLGHDYLPLQKCFSATCHVAQSPTHSKDKTAASRQYRSSIGRKSVSCSRLVKSWGTGSPGGQARPADLAVRPAGSAPHTARRRCPQAGASFQAESPEGRGSDLTRHPLHTRPLSPVPSKHSPNGAVGPGTDRGEVLVALGHLPHRLIQLLPVELGPLLRHLGSGARPARPGGRGRLCPQLQQQQHRHRHLLL